MSITAEKRENIPFTVQDDHIHNTLLTVYYLDFCKSYEQNKLHEFWPFDGLITMYSYHFAFYPIE
jgi:hypothetical protein